MGWTEQVFRYCERGQATGLFAEPVNALSNLAFLIVAWVVWRRTSGMRERLPKADLGFINLALTLVAAIGVGSFAFHVWATRWGQLLDVVPIAAFVVSYFAYALRMFVGLNWRRVFLGLGVMAACFALIAAVCPPHDAPSAAYECLNDTIGYVPALLALAGTGAVLAFREHPAASRLLAAAVVFLVSMILRTADLGMCDATRMAGHATGLHFLWHVLNAAVIYLLLTAALESAAAVRRREA